MRRILGLCLLLISAAAAAAPAAHVAFFRAIAVDNDSGVRSLLQRGLDPNLRNPDSQEPALLAALRADADTVFAMLVASPKIDLEARAANGDTALMLAAYKGKVDQVRALLAKKAQPNRPGWTALHYGAAAGNNEIITLLLERHAYIDAESPNRTTPLMMAARGGHANSVKLLLSEGADSRLRNEAGYTAMDFARAIENEEVASLLQEHVRRGGR